ncbi:MAG: Carbohydrate-binding family protein [Candidatus Beckwithbacteria bacterium GW2011_GWC2_47_9]|uniref:Dockerin domain-containing protein n=3 Tax=Microgenomates group TaxID=1794810 RepID=A0A1F5HTX5_9BACT|nr:MAG: Carbohydrate-binding family protein [Candidatus Curtissbacteria bacterium GW2011_GWA2_41_24]KKU88152.1 MAG: Carbohydrate-binding family protein [Candidatus Beckwithbacteria bacterium GW2011_GWC2_47_9]OGE07628.1 MAG: hypothetical protein A2W70_02470 [Candidatus Curtissbacteria bacterium RIFCSPLOWO2_02_41_11]
MIKKLDAYATKLAKVFSGSEYKNPTSFLKLLLAVIVAFGVLIFFLNTVDFNKLKSQTSFFQDNPPPPPPELYSPPQPPEDILSEGNVQGEQISPTTSSVCILYDFDGDGKVTQADVQLVIAMYGKAVGDSNYNDSYDLNRDGVIDASDVSMVTAQVGRVCASPTPTPSPLPTDQATYPYNLMVNLDMGCGGPASAQMVIFSWKPAISSVNWRVDVSDNNWQTRHSIYRFQISGDRVVSGWSAYNPMNDGLVPAFNTSYKWRVSNGLNEVSGPDIRTPSCPSPSPTPTPLPSPPTQIGCAPLRFLSMPSSVTTLAKVTVKIQVNGFACNGLPAWVYVGARPYFWQGCTLAGNSCSVTFKAPATAGSYPIVAVADLDRDGRWYENGEYDKRVLNVLRAPIPLPQ